MKRKINKIKGFLNSSKSITKFKEKDLRMLFKFENLSISGLEGICFSSYQLYLKDQDILYKLFIRDNKFFLKYVGLFTDFDKKTFSDFNYNDKNFNCRKKEIDSLLDFIIHNNISKISDVEEISNIINYNLDNNLFTKMIVQDNDLYFMLEDNEYKFNAKDGSAYGSMNLPLLFTQSLLFFQNTEIKNIILKHLNESYSYYNTFYMERSYKETKDITFKNLNIILKSTNYSSKDKLFIINSFILFNQKDIDDISSLIKSIQQVEDNIIKKSLIYKKGVSLSHDKQELDSIFFHIEKNQYSSFEIKMFLNFKKDDYVNFNINLEYRYLVLNVIKNHLNIIEKDDFLLRNILQLFISNKPFVKEKLVHKLILTEKKRIFGDFNNRFVKGQYSFDEADDCYSLFNLVSKEFLKLFINGSLANNKILIKTRPARDKYNLHCLSFELNNGYYYFEFFEKINGINNIIENKKTHLFFLESIISEISFPKWGNHFYCPFEEEEYKQLYSKKIVELKNSNFNKQERAKQLVYINGYIDYFDLIYKNIENYKGLFQLIEKSKKENNLKLYNDIIDIYIDGNQIIKEIIYESDIYEFIKHEIEFINKKNI